MMQAERLRSTAYAFVNRNHCHRLNSSLLIVALLLVCAYFCPGAFAASPSSGTLTPTTTGSLTFKDTATGTGAVQESACVEGVNCDTFTLTVTGTASNYTGKFIDVKIEWNVSANDYDLYVHKSSNTGPLVGTSAGGPPEVKEETGIDPSTLDASGTTVYTVHVVYFATTPLADQPTGTIRIQDKPVNRSATYIQGGGLSFSPNVTVKAPVAARDGEPSSRTDGAGNTYVAGIRGVPAGVDLWYFDLQPGSPTYDPFMRNPIYRGQPDSFTDSSATSVGADGGGDVDIAVGRSAASGSNNSPPTLAFTSLAAANISSARSTDKGVTFIKNPAGNVTGGAPVDDRQWVEFLGPNTVYLLYRTLAPAVTQIQRSVDGGLTYGPAATAGAIGQVGSIDVHQPTGTVYISGSSGQVCVGAPVAPLGEPLTYTCKQAASDPNGVAHLFFIVKVAEDSTPNGTAYVVYSNDHDIFLAHSQDAGQTWSLPVRVNDNTTVKTNVLPHIETGPTPGSVGIVWYGTTNAANDDKADWKVYYAVTYDATAQSPTFVQTTAGDHFIHGSNISEGGTLGNANRNLLDYFQVSFDPTGAAVIAYTDDHNDYDGHTYVTRQISGPGLSKNKSSLGTQHEGPALPPPPAPPSPDAPQVTDFAQDVAVGLLGVVPANDPLDILWVKYSCQDPGAGTPASKPMLVTTMKVSDLSTLPPASNWRTSFAANAPNSVLSPTGTYSFGLSDRGDQFYFRASTDPTQMSMFSFGTAVRNSDGSITYTRQGAADAGLYDQANNTITVKVALTKLNQFIPSGHAPIAEGAVLAGLRGQTFTSGANLKRDIARGGTQYTVQCGTGVNEGGNGGNGKDDGNIGEADGEGGIDNNSESFQVDAHNNFGDATNPPDGWLVYSDGRANLTLVSDTIQTFTQTGNQVVINGTGHIDATLVTFIVTLQDNGGAGKDYFSIVVPGYVARQGTLSSGAIHFHR